jgi:hypothetical protein
MGWIVFWKKASEQNFKVGGGDAQSFTIIDLQPNTIYEIIVQGVCGTGVGEMSDYSESIFITTLAEQTDRIICYSIKLTGYSCEAYVGQKWTSSQASQIVSNIEWDANAPYRLPDMGSLRKYNETTGEYEYVSNNTILEQGKYCFSMQVRIDGENGTKYRFPKENEGTLTAIVDDIPWATTTRVFDDKYSFVNIQSPEFQLKANPSVEELKNKVEEIGTYATDLHTLAVTYNYIQTANAISQDINKISEIFDQFTSSTTVSQAEEYASDAMDFLKNSVQKLLWKMQHETEVSLDALLEEGDSEAVKKIIDDAAKEVFAFTWDYDKTVAENDNLFNNTFSYNWYMGIKDAVEQQRQAEKQGVEEVTPSDSPSRGEKILRDGQLYIIVGDKTYDARGAEVR